MQRRDTIYEAFRSAHSSATGNIAKHNWYSNKSKLLAELMLDSHPLSSFITRRVRWGGSGFGFLLKNNKYPHDDPSLDVLEKYAKEGDVLAMALLGKWHYKDGNKAVAYQYFTIAEEMSETYDVANAIANFITDPVEKMKFHFLAILKGSEKSITALSPDHWASVPPKDAYSYESHDIPNKVGFIYAMIAVHSYHLKNGLSDVTQYNYSENARSRSLTELDSKFKTFFLEVQKNKKTRDKLNNLLIFCSKEQLENTSKIVYSDKETSFLFNKLQESLMDEMLEIEKKGIYTSNDLPSLFLEKCHPDFLVNIDALLDQRKQQKERELIENRERINQEELKNSEELESKAKQKLEMVSEKVVSSIKILLKKLNPDLLIDENNGRPLTDQEKKYLDEIYSSMDDSLMNTSSKKSMILQVRAFVDVAYSLEMQHEILPLYQAPPVHLDPSAPAAYTAYPPSALTASSRITIPVAAAVDPMASHHNDPAYFYRNKASRVSNCIESAKNEILKKRNHHDNYTTFLKFAKDATLTLVVAASVVGIGVMLHSRIKYGTHRIWSAEKKAKQGFSNALDRHQGNLKKK